MQLLMTGTNVTCLAFAHPVWISAIICYCLSVCCSVTLWGLYLLTGIHSHASGLCLLKSSGHYMYHQFNIQQLYVLPTQCIYVFCVDLKTNSHYFPININWLVCITETECLLRGTDWVFNYKNTNYVRYTKFRTPLKMCVRDGTNSVLILLTSCQQTCMTHTTAVCTVKNSWWWTEELSETCRVLFQK